jgi:hypothetical protein
MGGIHEVVNPPPEEKGGEMFSLIRERSLGKVVWDEGPALVMALAASEMFFKFHSFALESVAFLALWYVLGAATWAIRAIAPRQE